MPIRIHTDNDPADDGWLAGGREPPDGGLGAQVRSAIRELVTAYGPVAPRTAMIPRASVDLRGRAGGAVQAGVELRNNQAAAVVVSPELSSLVGTDGSSWLAEHHVHVRDRILQPGASTRLELSILIGHEVQPGRYAGEVMLWGVEGRLPVSLLIREAAPPIELAGPGPEGASQP